mmetsp:Transcript_13914/g.30209  ORF Transcript_13914/g.30209 Transcript_13914/m.30209 type:complete len:234 (-) Transcript_13914:480-1181(-)
MLLLAVRPERLGGVRRRLHAPVGLVRDGRHGQLDAQLVHDPFRPRNLLRLLRLLRCRLRSLHAAHEERSDAVPLGGIFVVGGVRIVALLILGAVESLGEHVVHVLERVVEEGVVSEQVVELLERVLLPLGRGRPLSRRRGGVGGGRCGPGRGRRRRGGGGGSAVIVIPALRRVGENRVGRADLFELFGRFGAAAVAIGVMFQGKAPISLFDINQLGILADFQHFIVIHLGHHG